MLKLIFHIILLVPLFLTAQVNIINVSLIDTSLHIAYIGIENTIELTGLKTARDSIFFTTTNGTITGLGKNQYVLKPFKMGECIVSFQTKKQRLATKTFRADTLGEMTVRLAGVRHSYDTGTRVTYATVQQIVNSPFLVIVIPGTFYKHKCQVTSFVLSMDGAGFEEASVQEEIRGYIIPERIVNIIKRLRKGDFMALDNIYGVCADGRRRKLKPIMIVIK